MGGMIKIYFLNLKNTTFVSGLVINRKLRIDMKLRFLATIVLAAMVLVGCRSKNSVTIEGKFFGASDRVVYLQELSPSAKVTIDSTITNSKGRFSFTIELKDSNPSFINIKMGGSSVPLLVAPGEKVKVESVGNIYINYTVEGSEGSTLLRELNNYTISTVKTMDSLNVLYNQEISPDRIQELGKQYSQTYVQLKRNAIGFMVRNQKSLASVVPLYQPVFETQFLFDSPGDIAYFRMVSESLGEIYPTSPYVASLRADINRVQDIYVRDSILRASLSGPVVNFIDISMKDSRGQERKLSELAGKVVLLDFTNSSDVIIKSINRELVETYDKYNERGFEVFQVSLDESKLQWLNSVTNAKLPWISVNDFQGSSSSAITSYNVTRIPANFLLDRHGNIVAKDLRGRELEAAVEGLL